MHWQNCRQVKKLIVQVDNTISGFSTTWVSWIVSVIVIIVKCLILLLKLTVIAVVEYALDVNATRHWFHFYFVLGKISEMVILYFLRVHYNNLYRGIIWN